MNILDRKILRNLWGMKGQAIAIALVIASGMATFIMSISTMHSLKLTQATFYNEYRFAEVFSQHRNPLALRFCIGVRGRHAGLRGAADQPP